MDPSCSARRILGAVDADALGHPGDAVADEDVCGRVASPRTRFRRLGLERDVPAVVADRRVGGDAEHVAVAVALDALEAEAHALDGAGARSRTKDVADVVRVAGNEVGCRRREADDAPSGVMSGYGGRPGDTDHP